MYKLGYTAVAVLLLAACGATPQAGARRLAPQRMHVAAAGQFVQEAFGERTYKLYVPGSLPTGKRVPLVVMLHGCTQDPDQIAAGTRLNRLAEREGFIALYPDQPRLAHAFKCWRWFDASHQQRLGGEPAAIAGMVTQVMTRRPIDAGAVFAAGISAGGAMAAVLGATWPDMFAAIGVASGMEYWAATNELEGRKAMSQGGPDPRRAGRRAFEVMGAHARIVPTIVFHGADDRIVAPLNGDQVIGQWAAVNDLAIDGDEDGDIDALPDGKEEGQAPDGKRYTRWFYKDADGKVLLEKVVVTGMGHAWSGGDPAGSYTDPQGPDATAMIWRFFEANRRKRAPRP